MSRVTAYVYDHAVNKRHPKNKKQTYGCGFKWESESKRQYVAIVNIAPRASVDAIVGVKEDDEACSLNGAPHGVQCWIIKTLPKAFGADDHTPEMGQCGDLLHNVDHGRS